MTPDRIERRTFGVEPRGYDRDEVRTFLFEVAAALRLAQHGGGAAPAAAALDITEVDAEGETFDRTSSEVAKILRAAELSAISRQEEAEAMADAILEQAHDHAEEIRRQASQDVDFQRDRARQMLVVAQERADALVAEAEARAESLVQDARAKARRQAEQILQAAHQRSDELAEAGRSLRTRLNGVRVQLSATISALDAPLPSALVDLDALDLDLDLRDGEHDVAEATPTPPSVVEPARPRLVSVGAPDDVAAADRVRAAVHAAMLAARTAPAEHADEPSAPDERRAPELSEPAGAPPNSRPSGGGGIGSGPISAPVSGADLVPVRPSVNRRLANSNRPSPVPPVPPVG